MSVKHADYSESFTDKSLIKVQGSKIKNLKEFRPQTVKVNSFFESPLRTDDSLLINLESSVRKKRKRILS